MYGHLYFEIQAENPERASQFYNEVFGWQFSTAQEGTPVEYWRINTGGTAGGMLKRPSATPPPECGTNAFVCSIEVDDFDRIAGKILKTGGKVALPKFAIPGVCWHGYFVDTEGNTFGMFQVDEQAG